MRVLTSDVVNTISTFLHLAETGRKAQKYPSPAVCFSLDSGGHISKDLMEMDVYPPASHKPPSWCIVQIIFTAFCWFTHGKSNLEEMWQDVIEQSRWNKHKARFRVDIVYFLSRRLSFFDACILSGYYSNTPSPSIFFFKLSFSFALTGLFFVVMSLICMPYDSQIDWKPWPLRRVICDLALLAFQQCYFLTSLLCLLCGFFIALLGKTVVAYLTAAGTFILLFVAIGMLHTR
ncbi:hypothetical protein DFH29DRAFT_999900 [Suillus ampliporus]|nr:hypothetical protein DFH29DRAFT_999900 [Suillus ampliporus]